ncbi:integral membrane protein-like protein [Sulfobacillus acidophilus DSM 10332]|uniref:Integral membrane protein-like protein n=1 Tax=Sulfobacillus acidophilus (strain ATCC 700253 / DSM 10332 / NAL) TaxID=679936 RepID=G8TVZ9_SULAD|nr:integral membrane protein-like protein [Sulfobacillus acidophilus DSM 10332]
MRRGFSTWGKLLMLVPGLLWLFFQAVHIYPPLWVMGGGHPDFSYYAYSFTHYAYSDVVALFGSRRLFLHLWPYFQNIIEYPVIIGFYMSFMALLPGFLGYFTGSALGLALAYVVAGYVLGQNRGNEAVWWWSLSPLLFVYGLLNWDLLGIVTWGLAVGSYRRRHYAAAGAWMGVGVLTKFFPIVLFPYLAYELWRQGGREPLKRLAGTFGLVAVGGNLPFALFARRGWLEFFTFNSGRPADPGVWGWLVNTHRLSLAGVNLFSLLATLAGGLFLLALVHRHRIGAVQAATAALAWWFLCNKVYSPQYLLWVYYALLWLDLNPWQLLVVNVTGLLDFWMAMRWLGLGTTGSPDVALFVDRVVPWVIFLRDLTLIWAFVHPWRSAPKPAQPRESVSTSAES